MSLKSVWEELRRSRRYGKALHELTFKGDYIEWEWNGVTHIFAMTYPNDWNCWCHVKPGEAYNHKLPNRGWPAEEATLAPFRLENITCTSCLFMWKLVKHCNLGGFLWEVK